MALPMLRKGLWRPVCLSACPPQVLREDVVSDGADGGTHRKLDVVRNGDGPVLVLLYVVIDQRVEALILAVYGMDSANCGCQWG